MKNCQDSLKKDLKDHCIGIDIKQKVRIKMRQMSIGINRFFVLVYLNPDANAKRYKAERCYLLKGVIKDYNLIINGKNVLNQPINSNIKQHEEIRWLTTGQG